MNRYLAAAALLHLIFRSAELFPWRLPFLLKAVGKKLPLLPESMRTRELPPDARFTDEQQRLVATIVHNAGIYNGILAGGLLWGPRSPRTMASKWRGCYSRSGSRWDLWHRDA